MLSVPARRSSSPCLPKVPLLTRPSQTQVCPALHPSFQSTGSSAQPLSPLLRSRSLVSLGLRGRGVWNPLKTLAECRLPLGHTVPLGSTRWQASPGQVAAGFWVLPRKGLRAESLGVRVREAEGSRGSTQNRKLYWSVGLEQFFALGMWLGKVVGAAWPGCWLLGALPIHLSQQSSGVWLQSGERAPSYLSPHLLSTLWMYTNGKPSIKV